MLLKLNRIDVDAERTTGAQEVNQLSRESECSLVIPYGIHVIGRGKFLDCDDARVSVHNAYVNVTENSIYLQTVDDKKPCYIKIPDSDRTITLGSKIKCLLKTGYKIGLLPDKYWYKVTCDESYEDHALKLMNNTEPCDLEAVTNQSSSHTQMNQIIIKKEKEDKTSHNVNSKLDPNTCTNSASIKIEPSNSAQQNGKPSTSSTRVTTTTNNRIPQPCRYGKECYRFSADHAIEYSHPTGWNPMHNQWRRNNGRKRRRTPSTPDSDSESVTDYSESDEDPYQTDGSDDWDSS